MLCSKYSCFCNESNECFPGMASECFFKPLVAISVAPVITGLITHFMFHSHCISIHILVSILLSVAWHSCPLVRPQLSVCMFSVFFFFNYYIWPLCHNYAVCNHSIILSHFHVHIVAWLCVRTLFQSFLCLVLCILNYVNMQQPYLVSLATHSSSKWGILRYDGQ